jgi:hypothetical protein
MKKRDIVVSVILTLITCGIYGLYWMACLNDDANQMAECTNAQSGGMVVLLSIITCGIYALYWNYQMGKRLYEIQLKKNQFATDNSILYLILALLGLSIVNYCLIQDELNKNIVA